MHVTKAHPNPSKIRKHDRVLTSRFEGLGREPAYKYVVMVDISVSSAIAAFGKDVGGFSLLKVCLTQILSFRISLLSTHLMFSLGDSSRCLYLCLLFTSVFILLAHDACSLCFLIILQSFPP